MLKINKIISLSMISIILSSNLYSLTFEVNTQNEYLKTFEKTFLSPDDHRIIVNCNNCGISKKDVKYYNILDNVNKDSNITFVLNNVSVTYNKEVFLNNMEHLFIKNDGINKIDIEQERNVNKTEINNNEYVLIDGEKVSLDVIKNLLNKKQNKPIPDKDYEPITKNKKEKTQISLSDKKFEPMKIEENIIQTIDNKKEIKNTKIVDLFENNKINKEIKSNSFNTYVIALYKNENQANNFVKSKLSKYDTKIIKNGKLYTLEINLNDGTKEEQLEFVRKYAKDAYLKKDNFINKVETNNIKKDVETKNTIKTNYKNIVGVYSGKTKLEVENYLKRMFYSRTTNVKKTNNGYYLGYIEINQLPEFNEIKKVCKMLG